MKKNIRKYITFSATIFIGCLFFSCETTSDNAGIDLLKMHIEDPIIETSEAGYLLSYNTFGFFKNRGADDPIGSGNTIVVPLQMKFYHINEEIIVPGFQTHSISASYENRDVSMTASDNPDVTIIGSELIVRLKNSTFSHDLKFAYQRAKYSIGGSVCYLQYHKFSNPQLGRYELMNLSNAIVDGVEYKQKLYKNSLTVDVNKVSYTVDIFLTILHE